jgi:ABC-2 type transport system ATP-binding protein
MNVVEIDDLTKDYETGFWTKRKVRALDGLSLAVKPGQVFGFLGGNGAGKTTTIKILMTLLFPTAGSARILGKDISDVSVHRKIGYSPENPYFYDYLTALELMNYFGELLGLPTAERKRKSEELLSRVGLDEKSWSRQLRKFSKGMLQRVSLAQALIGEPEVVFLDEPMSGLDPIGRREVRELIAGLRESGTTVFMSTHILSDVEALCDEVAILTRGKLNANGRLEDLLAKGDRSFEVHLSGTDPGRLAEKLGGLAADSFDTRGASTYVRVSDERAVASVVEAATAIGGQLISVQAAKQSLEDLFASPTAGHALSDQIPDLNTEAK